MLRRGNSMVGTGTEPSLGEDLMLQDWLQKRSTSLQLVWKRRWCVLRDGQLRYYRSNTDTKPLGVLHLVDYSILTSGPDVSRKSKHAFRLSAPEPIPHQNQHHLFFTESALSLHKWTHALQAHIDHAMASWASMAAASDELRLQLIREEYSKSGGKSVIDKVLERLQLEESNASNSSDNHTHHQQQHDSRTPRPVVTIGTAPLPCIPANFPLGHADNNDTWSSTSSMPASGTNANTTTLDGLFAPSLQQQTAKSSMDSIRDSYNLQSPLGIHTGSSGIEFNHTGGEVGIVGYHPGAGFMEQQSSTSDVSRSSMQSDYQGRTSLQQPRVAASKTNSIQQTPSPRICSFTSNKCYWISIRISSVDVPGSNDIQQRRYKYCPIITEDVL
ncbi:hypothetical protein BGX31_000932 [Mortierella sp. GBA43]|nr:hypothetical protein BGX31_000932 [Mortierella sp. GBA43]